MPFDQHELLEYSSIISNLIERIRPEPQLREEIDIGFKVEKYSITIMEIRSNFPESNRVTEFESAKITYVKKANKWKLYWKRADGKWYAYPALPESDSLKEIVKEIERDEHSCFFG